MSLALGRVAKSHLLALVLLATSIGGASATVTLTGAMIFDGVPPDGIGFVWSTNSYGYYLFMADGSPAAPMINDSSGHISYALSPGDYSFYLFGDWDRGTPKATPWGLSLTFDGQGPSTAWSSQLGIGVTTPEAVTDFASQPLSQAWAGSLEYTSGNYSVTLEDFNIIVVDQTGYDRVSPFSATANGRDDAVGLLKLGVKDNSIQTPEPITLSLFGAGLAGAVAIRRRKKQTT